MLRLDVATLTFAAAMTSLVSGFVYAAYGLTRHQNRRWTSFSLSALSYGIGLLIIPHLGPQFRPILVLITVSLLAIAALALHDCCARQAGKPVRLAPYAIFLVIYVGGSAYFTFINDSITGKIALGSLLRAPLFLHAALILHQYRGNERGLGLRLLKYTLTVWALALTVRGVAAASSDPLQEFITLEGYFAFYYIMAGLAYAVILAALMLIDAEHLSALLGREASRHAEALETQIARQVQTQTELSEILDNLPDIFYRTDREGRLKMISRSVETQMGYRVEELLGKDSALFHSTPDSRANLVAALEASGGSIIDYELRLRHKDGHDVWASASSRFYHDSSGERAGTEGVVRLIEERKRTELFIRESQSLIQAMLDASSDAIMLFRPDGTLLAVNEVMAERFGRKAAELTGTCLWDMFPPDVSRARKEACDRVLSTGQAIHYLDRRGELYLDNSIYPVMGVNGIPDKLAVYSRDITAQTLAETKISTYLAELERSNAELEQFAYVASHDLREPLRMISSYLSLLERRYGGSLEGDGLEFLAFARDGAKRMDRLVLDLLELSRIDRKGSPIIAMDVEPSLRQALRHLEPAIAESGARIQVADDPPRVMGDPEQILRLFQNLIGNAVKYRAKDRPPSITVSWRHDGTVWDFTIADNGIGIDPQFFERIFGIFQRLHTADRYEGTGIGLALCRKIVERHSGRIWLDSVPGEGTSFHFTLPAAA